MIVSYVYNSIPERLHIIGGMLCLLIGYFILLYTQNYFNLFVGGFLFITGVVDIVKNIHSIYLWQWRIYKIATKSIDIMSIHGGWDIKTF